MIDASKFQDLKARVTAYQNLKKEFYELDIDDNETIDRYIELFQQFNDEFVDVAGELGIAFTNVCAMSAQETDDFVELARTFIGHSYVWGAEGEVSDEHGLCFDCSGFITYLMKETGLMPQNGPRLVVNTIPTCGYFYEVPWASRQRGDVLCPRDMSHVVVYEGNEKIVHASNSARYPQGGVKESNLYFKDGRAFRIKGYGVE